VPIGIWTTFADHGTVNKSTFVYYNEDHHGAATHVVEDTIRRLGKVPRSQDVVNAYGNTDEGDMSAGLTRDGPAAADYVGRVEAAAMLRAWKQAGRHMTSAPVFDQRWTRVCFCGGEGSDSHAVTGLPLFTGSEEGRGPLYDVTHEPFEGRTGPERGAQGDKIQVTDQTGGVPQAVPIVALRIADRMIVSVPGEMTVDMGRRIRSAVVEATKGAGVTRAVISGIANEYIQYLTTPEEYQRQHYEGGSTLFGKLESVLIQTADVDLAKSLAEGKPAPTPYDFDPTNGVKPDGPAFPDGADRGRAQDQPKDVERLQRAEFKWSGGQRGYDRPVDAAFVSIQSRGRDKRWHHVTNDLGLQIIWAVDPQGMYDAKWEVPLSAREGNYRFVVSAKKYRLSSQPFHVQPSTRLEPKVISTAPGRVIVQLAYPQPVVNVDITYRPDFAAAGSAKFVVDGKPSLVEVKPGGRLVVTGKPGATATLGAGAARDRYGNGNADAVSFTLSG
jgi:hypothetical protein